MNTQLITEELHIVLVNPAQELKNYYIDSFEQENCVFSCYSRPDRSDHPPLQPIRRHMFNIVVYDIGSDIGRLSEAEVMHRQFLPHWFQEFVGQINQTLCIFLIPGVTLQPISIALKSQPRWLKRFLSKVQHIELVIREPAYWEEQEINPAQEIREHWNRLI